MGTGASAASGPQDKSFLETMVDFTKEATDAVANSTAPDLVKKWTEKRNEMITKIRGGLEEEERSKAVTMITLLQEQIYTAKGLPDNWASEVKYEQTESGFEASCGEHKIQLGSHFPAGQVRLVVTPLSRICRQKIFEGAATGKVVCFQGPPGTGKTETMKDTLKDLGWDVIVCNCSESTKSEQLKEAIAEGKPIVFDEFFRLPEDVQKEFADLIPKEKPAIGITGNPATGKVIDEVSSQCVSQDMLVPDYSLIAEIMLFCEGFLEGDVLAPKLVNLLQACKEKLSKQGHYDFGLRKLKSLTKECAAKARAEDFKDENLIVANTALCSLYDMATAADRELLKDLAKEHFGAEVELPADATEGDRWVRAAAAIGRASKLRHGAMFANVSKDDEEACVAAAGEAAKAAGAEVVRMPGTMSVSLDEFIGKQNGDDWSEGAFTKALREANDKKAWLLVFCGEGTEHPVGQNFEALHSLLDDNKVLLLETGEKIRLLPDSRVIFVNMDCSALSPASVSRLGIVWSE